MPAPDHLKTDDAKPALRRQARAARAAASAAGGEAAAQAVCRTVLDRRLVPAGATVGGYWPIGRELDARPLLGALGAAGCWCALPVMVGPAQPLRFRLWRPGEPLVPGPGGIPEPAEGAPELLPEVLLVPLLGFDAAGHRLGQGGGYYDRTLAAMRAAGGTVRAIGLAFAVQEFPALPVAGHDQRLDWIVTETACRAVGSPRTE
ncbi:MAG: 5-formyltetrahydrofolate cyclo-ligase [Rhodospirillaceae bacterium]